MADITRFKPIDDVFDDMFRGFFMRPVRFEGQPDMTIKMDVTEDDKNYVVHAEIPGVKKEDIHITMEGNQIAISAEVKSLKEAKKDDKVLRSERYYGKVLRTFSLEQDVDDAAAQATYTDGVLELVLPKKAGSRSRQVTVK